MAMGEESIGSSLLSNELKTRWLAPDPEGGTRRDAFLHRLRSVGRIGGDNRSQMLDLRGISLAGEELSEVDLAHCDLSDADLSNANLTRAKLTRSHLRRATLYQTHLDEAELFGADLSESNCNECHAPNAGFGAANLSNGLFFGAQMQGATLSHAHLSDSDFRAANLQGSRICQSDLRHANLARADLRRADLTGSQVHHVCFDNADLQGAHLRELEGYEKASWVNADIRQVDFCGAYMVRRHIMDENFLHEFRNQGRSYELIYKVWWLTSDCGRSMTRWALCTAGIALIFAILYTVVDIDYGENKNYFSPIYYSIVTLTTLGYGDILPKSSYAQILSSAEVILGYLSGGGLISIFTNKMSRRAE